MIINKKRRLKTQVVLLFFGFALFNTIELKAQFELQKSFTEYNIKGSTTLFDSKNNKWIYTDSADSKLRTLPASTFKIINSCIALELKVIKDENELIKWDGRNRSPAGMNIPAWNRDNNLKEAYRNSTVWFYVELARRIGKKRYRSYLKKCNYGNQNLSEKGVDFWNYGELAISPKEQIDFLRAFYDETLPFSKRTYAIMNKHIMLSDKTSEQTNSYVMRYKTGWTDRNGMDIGWCVGYVERADNVYFFATRLTKAVDDQNPNFIRCRKDITKVVLAELHVLD